MFSDRSEKIRFMEAQRGLNHPQPVLQEWIQKDFGVSGFPRSIHVAGTNGKGSTITWLEVLLKAKGLSTGSFTSPHLLEHRERLRINGTPISNDQWESLFDESAERFIERQMTMFEMDLFMACSLFQNEQPDWVLMETGMGGERDATTALDYPVAIVTQTGMDHMAFLGSTKEEIARSKAGVIKPSMQIITAERNPACLAVYKERAARQNARLTVIPEEIDHEEDFWNPALPAYQKDNFLCAKTALEQAGFSFSVDELRQAVQNFFWPARFQILRADPLLLLDGAHNGEGIDALCRSLKQSPWQIEQIYFSVLADKQADRMIDQLRSLGARLTLVAFESYRLGDLEKLAARHHLEQIDFETMIKQLPSEQENTLICGSLYFAGDVLKALKAMHGKESR